MCCRMESTLGAHLLTGSDLAVQMLTESKSQSILISGESGAGKTEAMKIALT